MMNRACDRILSFYTPLIVAFILMSSSYAICGEIHDAVTNNDSVKVEKLIRQNPDLVFSKNENGFTPLQLAVTNGYIDIVQYLLTTKADVNARNNYGGTPLHLAAMVKGQHGDLVEMLLAHGADVNACDAHALTPLHYAALVDNPDAVRLLLDHGAKVNARDNKVGDTPLILAAGKGYKEVVELLLAHGADVNLADNEGTPLAWAIHTGHPDIADLLRKHGGHE